MQSPREKQTILCLAGPSQKQAKTADGWCAFVADDESCFSRVIGHCTCSSRWLKFCRSVRVEAVTFVISHVLCHAHKYTTRVPMGLCDHNQTLGRWYALYAGWTDAPLRGEWVKAPEP
eukprot:3342492-Pleurochrysis_carterae.AAC.1